MIKLNKKLFGIIVFANIAGALFGFTSYYGYQLSNTPPALKIFVPDCPLYALLFAIVLILVHAGVRANLAYYLVSVGAVKYGFWTVYVLLKYNSFYFQPGAKLMYALIFAGHIGLFLQSLMLLGRIKVKSYYILPALGWFLLNDSVDYTLSTYPPLPAYSLNFMYPATVVMTVFFTLTIYIIYRRIHKRIIVW